jgi:hypothetical protein
VDRTTKPFRLDANLPISETLAVTTPPKRKVFLGLGVRKFIVKHSVNHRFSWHSKIGTEALLVTAFSFLARKLRFNPDAGSGP